MDIFGIRRLHAHPIFSTNHADGIAITAETLVGHTGISVAALPFDDTVAMAAIVNTALHEALRGCNASDQTAVDERLLAVRASAKKTLPLSLTMAISTAIARAGAKATGRELAVHLRDFTPFAGPGWRTPTPLFDALSQGEHGGLVTFAINPRPAHGPRRTVAQLLSAGRRLFAVLPRSLHRVGHVPVVSASGAWYSPDIGVRDALDALVMARHTVGISEDDVGFGLRREPDVFFLPHFGAIRTAVSTSQVPDTATLGAAYAELARRYPLGILEDPFSTAVWEEWNRGRQQLPRTQLFADRAVSLEEATMLSAATNDAIHGVTVDIALAPTLSTALTFAVRAKGAGVDRLVAPDARSADPVAADVAVAIGAEYIRLGTTSHWEHVGQYNRLNELATHLGL